MLANPEFSEKLPYDIDEELKSLKDSIEQNHDTNKDTTKEYNDFSKYVSSNFMGVIWISQIPEKVWSNFILKFRNFYNWEKILDYERNNVDSNLISNIFWNLQSETKNIIKSNLDLAFLFYIKEICPKNYEEIFVYFKSIYEWIGEESYSVYALRDPNTYYDIIKFIKKHKDESLKYFKFCSCYNWTHMKKTISSLWIKDNLIVFFEKYAASLNFWETFVEEEESANLFNYLSLNPIKLTDLEWNIIKEIDLDINKWINFCFRGIIEMVKSRPDINFPHLNENASESEKIEWAQQWEKIIKEYENMLRNYISKDFEVNDDWKKIQKPKNKTFDKIFYTRPYWDDIIDDYHTDTATLNEFTQNEISEYSFNVDPNQSEEYYEKTGAENKEAKEVSNQFLSDIESYVKNHPNEKILVCIDQHGRLDGSSRNGRKKEDWIKLANISSNVKIWSIRCFFWMAYDNENIYNHKSSLSWFSNKTVTTGYISNIINDANEKGLWFHEMEIYARLNYSFSATPLTESMKYTNRNTWETEIWKIGLAQNDNQNNNSDVTYA